SVVEIGDDVSVGHNAIIHGAKVGSKVLVGMGAILMDNAEIADNTIIAAGAVVLSNIKLDPGVYAGIPAKKVKEGSDEVGDSALKNARGYMMYKEWYLNCYEEVALEPESDGAEKLTAVHKERILKNAHNK
ncbi:MAG TPA: hypothetical protein DF637_01630, partial [Rikenellaceae bacterium]|nr:hypothetical protein [Rikenellaceae bacterium]